ncbi:TonB-dependent receptor [uncultured Bacteroides sp.]|uniref:SusC/RagA family TonB-linked outer membrane protein n=1 Tax=uncultured Bacteroides sp. TaxID=162156 RepID=UPI00280AF683|nr:TonB-dependent receptor [uncultured Bacteroides sp.]
MKVFLACLFCSVSMLYASDSYAQRVRVELGSSRMSVGEVLKEIESQSDFDFFYNNSHIDLEREVSVPAERSDIFSVLDAVFSGTDVNYAVLDRKIILSTEVPSRRPVQQSAEIKGRIVDQNGEAIIGATVRESGTSNGTISDFDGNFTLNVASASASLEISYIGYETQTVKATPGKVLLVTLRESSQVLDEVVVVGFGTQKKVNLTGAVGLTDAESLKERPVLNATQALQGLVPGLQITQSNGTLGDTPTINIRGTGTIGEGSSGSPLILIDGMEGDLNMINPQDIASVSVLKDAASSSIYGSRAPFGVILITTKSGGKGKVSINYNNSFRWSSPIKMMEMMNSVDFASFLNDAMTNSGRSPQFTLDHVNRMKDYMNATPVGPGTRRKADGSLIYAIDPDANGQWLDGYANGIDDVNIFDEIYKGTTFNQEHNFSASGGSDKLNYYVSFNYLHQDGLMKIGDDDLKRYNATAKFNMTLTNWLKLNLSMRFSRQDYKHPFFMDNWEYYELVGRSSWPNIPLYDRNGYYFNAPSVPLKLAEQGSKYQQADNLYQQVGFVIEPIKNWVTHINFNYRINNVFNRSEQFAIYNHDINGEPYSSDLTSGIGEDISKENYYNFEVYSEYTHSFKDKHNLHVLVGSQIENLKQQTYNLYRDGVILNSKPEIDLTTGLGSDGSVVSPTVGGQRSEWGLVGFFGRLNYDYEGKYLFEGNLRYDGSSRFRRSNRWKLFPSFSLGWNIAREDFFEPIQNVVSLLKLRASYGTLGNQNTNNWYQTYQTINLMIAGGNWLQNGIKPNASSAPSLVSAALTWETVETYNAGMDWALFDNRLTGSFDYFVRNTKNMVGKAPELPAILGTDVPVTNNTDLRTLGWELNIGWQDRLNNGLSYSATFLLSDSRTKITRYPNNPTGSIDTYIAGRYTNEIWGYETYGIARTDEEMQKHLASADQNSIGTNWAAGDVMYKDRNNDGKVSAGARTIGDPGDLTVIGNSTPRYHFGIDLNASWKGFDIRVFFQGIMKRDFWQGSPFFFGGGNDVWWAEGITDVADYFRNADSWSVQNGFLTENTDAYLPRPSLGWDNKNYQCQNGYLQSAAYIRLKNLQLGYSLPREVLNKIGVQNLRVYVSGENLWTGTKLADQFDPETVSGGSGGNAYPLSRTVSCGISLTF